MITTPITKQWAESKSIQFEVRSSDSGNYDWIAYFDYLRIVGNKDRVTVWLRGAGTLTQLSEINTVEQIELINALLSGQSVQDIVKKNKAKWRSEILNQVEK